jgi:hypothetical protein
MQYKIVGSGQGRSLALVVDGRLETIGAAHLNFDQITDYLRDGGSDPAHVRSLLNVPHHVAAQFRALSERVAFDGHRIVFDGDPIDTALSRHLVRLLRQGADVRPVVAFLEKLATNPSHLSKIHLWTWLTDRDFTITAAGDVIGYKGVRNTEDNSSIHAGTTPVRVNGVTHVGTIPNPLGAVVAIPRSVVDPSRDHGCSVGLHVGTFDYARQWAGGYGGRVLTVAVNPRDVVAVPRDCENAKMRVCQYTVLDVTDIQLDTALYPGNDGSDIDADEHEDVNDGHHDAADCDVCSPSTAFAIA